MGRRNSTNRIRDSPELNRSDTVSGSINHKSKKRKSPAKHIVEGDSSQSPAAEVYSQEEARSLKLQRKGNKKSCDREAAATKVSGYSATDCNNDTITSSSLEDRKSDIACQPLNTEAPESISYSQSPDTRTKKKKWTKRKKKSVPNAASVCEANEAVAKIDKGGSSTLDREEANGSVVRQDIGSAPSTICDQSMETKVKKRKERNKSKELISNADINCEANGISSQEKSDQGGDFSLSVSIVRDKCNHEAAEVVQPQRKKHEEAGGILNQNIDSAPSTVCDQVMETKAKKRKRPRKSKKFMGSVSDADGNPEASCFTSQENSHQGGDLSLSVVSGMGNQAVAEVLQQRKENDNPGSIVNQDVVSAPSTACNQNMEPEGEKRKKRRNRGKKKKENIDSIANADTNLELGGISSHKKVSVGSSSLVDQSHLNSDIRNVKLPSLSSRKLVILDLNGLLADIRSEPLEGSKPDKLIRNKAVYKRPFCDDFLQFCFKTFDVAVWSSRNRVNVQQMVGFLMSKDKRKKLIFIRDQSHCTKTGFKTIENKDKPIFLKELQQFWNKSKVYNQSNTLLIDDSPCKALLNPPYTGIFPNTYECSNDKDDSLGPVGDLRLYLKKLAEADNVQEFVKENPFGQIPITDSHPSWDFYSKVIAPKPPSKRSLRTHCPPAIRRNYGNAQEVWDSHLTYIPYSFNSLPFWGYG